MRIRLPRKLRRLSARLVSRKTLAAKPYALYRAPVDCDTDDFGRPNGRYATLAEAMAATGYGLEMWQSDDHCPDEAYVLEFYLRGIDWSVIKPGVAAEVRALRQALGCCEHWSPQDGCPYHTGRMAMSLAAREVG